jgi:glutaredoxin 3
LGATLTCNKTTYKPVRLESYATRFLLSLLPDNGPHVTFWFSFFINLIVIMSIAEKISSIIKSNRVAVFSKTYCPHCAATKSALSNAGVKFHLEELDKWNNSDMTAAQDFFAQTTGAKTVPRVYINGNCIGGNSDFQAQYVQTGKIKELL